MAHEILTFQVHLMLVSEICIDKKTTLQVHLMSNTQNI